MSIHSFSYRRARRWLATLVAFACLNMYGLTAHGQSWSLPQPIESDNGTVSNFDLAVSPNGNAIAVWSQSDGVRSNIWASNYIVAQSTWTAPQLIETRDTGNAQFPRVALAANGSAAVVWQQFDGGRFNVWGNRFFPDTGWRTAARIQSGLVRSGLPSVAMDSHGFAFAVWPQADSEAASAPFSIYAAQSIGEHWSAPQVVENRASFAHDPSVAVDDFDNAIVVWDQSELVEVTRSSVYSSHYEWFGQRWAEPVLIASGSSFAFDAEMLTSPSGAALAVYRRQTSINFPVTSLWAASFQDAIFGGGTWMPEQQISTAASGFSISQATHSVNVEGDAFAVWVDSTSGIWANRFADRAWDAPQRLAAGSGNIAGPAVTIDPNGNAVAAWMQTGGGGSFDVLSSHFTRATGWSNPQPIEFDSGGAFNPKVGSDAKGHVLAIWTQFDGVRSNLLWSRFVRDAG